MLKASSVLCALALLGGAALPGQSVDWQRIVKRNGPQTLPEEHLAAAERQALERMLVASKAAGDECDDEPGWQHKIVVHRVPLARGHYTLAESGPGCARGGQGANGAMWMVRWGNGTPALLGELDGWFHAVQPGVAHGLHDVTVGWHNSADEFGLALYRFNGTEYRAVDDVTVRCSEETHGCVPVPKPRKPQRAGAVATPTKESAQP